MPLVPEALTALACAEDPTVAREALKAARRALGEEAARYEPLMELLCRRATELARLRRLAGSDELTGLANRRAFKLALDRERARLERGGIGPAVVLIDLDDMKSINDDLGHAAGDEALQHVAEALQEAVRGSDLVARLGGDELALLLPETCAQGARAVAERARRFVEARSVRGRPLRTSVGWAVASPDEPDALLQTADARLYADKRRRRRGQSRSPSAAA
ncbi:MAG: GGDEF domain-containing protein [Sandaracinaceae bacterium]|nr:MAG: GGDEF domain-containing protein [Sandaracinaceae bacterium]